MSSINDKFKPTYNAGNPNVARVTATRSGGGTTLTCDNLSGWPVSATGAVDFSTYKIDTNNAVVANTQIDWVGLVTSPTTIGSLTRIAGATDTGSAIGDVVEANPTANWANNLFQGLTNQHNALDGSHGAVTATSVVASGNITAANFIQSGGAGAAGWTVGLATPNTVTANGNRSYTCVFNAIDLTGTVSNGMRLRFTRTVAAPTQCTSLNGTTQYYSKTAPAGVTATDNLTAMGWVKLSSYGTLGGTIIARRSAGISGWQFKHEPTGQLTFIGFNTSVYKGGTTYQSLPLNKWVHVAATLNLSGSSYNIYIDGVLVPSSTTSGSGAISSLTPGGDLTVGAYTGGNEFIAGKIAQAAVFSAVLSQATIQSYISQGLAGTETSLISAYSFNNSINDLNANGNNLTANGSAVATNADSPFAQGATAGTLEYGIVTSNSFSTNTTLTVQVPEGSAIPTTGGVSAVSYSSQGVPYGFPKQKGKWLVESHYKTDMNVTSPVSNTWYNIGSMSLNYPIGEWMGSFSGNYGGYKSGATEQSFFATLSTTNNSETDRTLSVVSNTGGASGTIVIRAMVYRSRPLSLTTSTTYYLNCKIDTSSVSSIDILASTFGTFIISAECAYL